jgi:hypothetical protein
MPKQPIDYSKSIIYKIVSNNQEVKEVYVGSTTDFKSRKNRHKLSCNYETGKHYNIKLYKTIRENGGWDNYVMTPIIEYPCENRIQLLIKEEEHRKELNAELNMIKCYTGLITQEYHKLYREENKDEIRLKNTIYREKNKEKYKEKSKLYRDENLDELKKKKKEYYENNRGKILERANLYYQNKTDKASTEFNLQQL